MPTLTPVAPARISLEDAKLIVDRCGLCRRYRDSNPDLMTSCQQVVAELGSGNAVVLFFTQLHDVHVSQHQWGTNAR